MLFDKLEKRLSYSFSDKMLLIQALTHRSYGRVNYERLEFLGDSILNTIIASELFHRFPEFKEGHLSRLRAELVKEETLVHIASYLLLSEFLKMGEGEIKSGGKQRASILADASESLIGAIFLDGGMFAVYKVINKLFSPLFATLKDKLDCKDAKTSLQEFCQSKRFGLPIYEIVQAKGAAHDQCFKVTCYINELAIKSYGIGRSRRSAEQKAASSMIKLLKNHLTTCRKKKTKD